MRGGGTSVGVVAVIIVAALLALAGCGGGEDRSNRTDIDRMEPHSLPEMRGAIQRAVDANLAKLKAPAKTTACVDRNIEAMSAQQIAERLVETGPPDPRSVVEYLGPLGKGCP